VPEPKPPRKSSPKLPQSFSRLSDKGVVERRKRIRDHNGIAILRSFRTHLESVPQALQSQKIVPLGELASKLGVEPKRLLPAIEHGYLKVVSLNPPTVYEPPPAAMDWLRLMFQPLTLRPFVSSEMVGELEGLSAQSVRRLCLDYGIPIYSDPVFGELMSISAFYRFHQQMHSHRAPSRFDRQAMLWTLLHQQTDWRETIKPPRFSKRLELEIRRIANLDEPARTDAALRLWNAWSETRKVWASIAAVKGMAMAEEKAIKPLETILRVEMPSGDDGD
jgi:hypothetical protein